MPALRSSAPTADENFRPLGLEMTHEAEQRRVDRQRDVCRARRLAELLGPRVVHPEAALEVDLAGVVAALEQDLDRPLRVVAGGNAGQADTDAPHTGKLPGVRPVTRNVPLCGDSDAVRYHSYP